MPDLARHLPEARHAFPRLSAERRRRLRLSRPAVRVKAQGWRDWTQELFPEVVTEDFAPHHVEMWDWAAAVARGEKVPPLVAILARAGGKTSTLDLMVVYLLAHGAVRFPVIVAKDYAPAEDRVISIRSFLESSRFRERYPEVGEPATNRNTGAVIAWGKRFCVTESGQAIQAVSLLKVKRGINFRGERPDFRVLDDIDDTYDTTYATKKKEGRIGKEVARLSKRKDSPLIFVQNLIHGDGVAAHLCNGKASYFAGRKVIGPIPAIRALEVERYEEDVPVEGGTSRVVRHRITSGVPSWSGQGLEECQAAIDEGGLSSFRWEMQHECHDHEGALLSSSAFRYHLDDFDPRILVRVVVGVDPSGGRAECGIVAVGRDSAWQFYVLEDATVELGPGVDWARAAVMLAAKWGGSVAVEANYGGEELAVKPVRDAAEALRKESLPGRIPEVEAVYARHDKGARAQPAKRLYLDGRIVHLARHGKLEREWTTWVPDENASPNRLDAEVHAVNVLNDRAGIQPPPSVEHAGAYEFAA